MLETVDVDVLLDKVVELLDSIVNMRIIANTFRLPKFSLAF